MSNAGTGITNVGRSFGEAHRLLQQVVVNLLQNYLHLRISKFNLPNQLALLVIAQRFAQRGAIDLVVLILQKYTIVSCTGY